MTFLKSNDLSVVIVTYGERQNNLKQTLYSLIPFNNLISNIILVQNGIDYDIKKFVSDIDIPLNITYKLNKNNTGSAGGFKVGIDTSLQEKGNKVLILDDDCLIPKETIEAFKENNILNKINSYGSNVAISLYRPMHDQDATRFKRNYDFSLKYYKNTICSFSIMHKLNNNFKQKRLNSDISESVVAPYSGLLISKNHLRNVEPINPNYFVYGDDTRLTARLTQMGIKIITIEDLYSIDTEKSWYQNDEEVTQIKNDVQLFLEMKNFNNLWRPYYRIRNGICNSNNVFKYNSFLFFLNLIIFIFIPFFAYMPKNKIGLRNYKYFIIAVFEGLNNKLGKKNIFKN